MKVANRIAGVPSPRVSTLLLRVYHVTWLGTYVCVCVPRFLQVKTASNYSTRSPTESPPLRYFASRRLMWNNTRAVMEPRRGSAGNRALLFALQLRRDEAGPIRSWEHRRCNYGVGKWGKKGRKGRWDDDQVGERAKMKTKEENGALEREIKIFRRWRDRGMKESYFFVETEMKN